MNYELMYYLLAFIYFNPGKTEEEIYDLYVNAEKESGYIPNSYETIDLYIFRFLYQHYWYIRYWKDWEKMYANKVKAREILNKNGYEIDDGKIPLSEFEKSYRKYKKQMWIL